MSTPDPATPMEAVTEAWPEGTRFHAPGHRIYFSAGATTTGVDLCTVPGCGYRDPDDQLIAAACADNGHAWWKNTGDGMGGLTGSCACGSVLHGVDGDDAA